MSDKFWTRITFRAAERADTPLILALIRELAEYENMVSDVKTDTETLENWLFDKRAAEVLIAETDGAGVGYALFFSNFSTFLGKAGLYLEDLYVKPQYREHGIGKAMLSRLAKIAADRDYGRVEWSCLDWNKPSIDFYHSLGAASLNEWTTFRLTGDALTNLAKGGVS